jgi:hypothetical protein
MLGWEDKLCLGVKTKTIIKVVHIGIPITVQSPKQFDVNWYKMDRKWQGFTKKNFSERQTLWQSFFRLIIYKETKTKCRLLGFTGA